jgi:pimeloyl-ACP methyl ester carboxylesterase
MDHLFLMAPDGLRFDFWHFFVTRTTTGQWLFKSVIENPGWVLSLASLLGKTKLVSSKMIRFISSHLEEKQVRQKVYDTWMITRDLVPDLALASGGINSNKINVQLFFGKYDVIIPPKLGKRFIRLLQHKSDLHILDCGHKVMKMKDEIMRVINESMKERTFEAGSQE